MSMLYLKEIVKKFQKKIKNLLLFFKTYDRIIRLFETAMYNSIRRGIEVVITGLTRNQFVLTHTGVRIPPSPP